MDMKILGLSRSEQYGWITFFIFGLLFLLALIFLMRLTSTTEAATKLQIGDRVTVTTGVLNVRSSGKLTASLVGTQKLKSSGKLIAGPVSANGYVWWQIDYDKGADGWSADRYLQFVSRPAQAPAPQRLHFGAYLEDGQEGLADFEEKIGAPLYYYASFVGFGDEFPLDLYDAVGQKGKTLVIFLEPVTGYDEINAGHFDVFLKRFADDAAAYRHPIIVVPFPEMNLDEEAWGYGENGNTPEKFKEAWKRTHDILAKAPNIKFGLAYNHISVPDRPGNQFSDYYPGDNLVDYVGADGFNFATPWLSFSQVFDKAMEKLKTYKKPILIFSMGSAEGKEKANWIDEGLGKRVKQYPGLIGWIWFNEHGERDWRADSDPAALAAFRRSLPK